jgi:hypothetical protein
LNEDNFGVNLFSMAMASMNYIAQLHQLADACDSAIEKVNTLKSCWENGARENMS